jgi:hypothetical protein
MYFLPFGNFQGKIISFIVKIKFTNTILQHNVFRQLLISDAFI